MTALAGISTYHAFLRIPEAVDVAGWLETHGLAEWGQPAKGWSEYQTSPLRELFAPPRETREVTLTVDAPSEPAAAQALERAAREVGGYVLAGPLRADFTPAIRDLVRMTKDLGLDGHNYLNGAALTPERATHLADQAEQVSLLMTELVDQGYRAHPAVADARDMLEMAAWALSRHEPVAGLAKRVTAAWREQQSQPS